MHLKKLNMHLKYLKICKNWQNKLRIFKKKNNVKNNTKIKDFYINPNSVYK